MQTLLLEWLESFGRAAPAWVEKMSSASPKDRANLLVRFLAGAEPSSGAPMRDSDEMLTEILSGLPRDGDVASMFDVAGTTLLTRAESPDNGAAEPTEEAGEVILREAAFRLLRVVGRIPESLPQCVKAVAAGFDVSSPALLVTSDAQDVAGEVLQVLAKTQDDDRYLPLWWRLCDLEGFAPRHAAIGPLGLRWRPGDRDDIADLLGYAFGRMANACVRASSEELLSETATRRVFLSSVRATRSERRDLPWSEIGSSALSMSDTGAAEAIVRRAFGLEEGIDRRPVQGRGRYEDPERARAIAGDLEANKQGALARAQDFLDGQRAHAQNRGDALPLVQSLCFFATRIKTYRPEIAMEWAREAGRWQPHNPYPAVILAEILVAEDRAGSAAGVLLDRFLRITAYSAVWNELGRLLAELGERPAARECLTEAVERFPDDEKSWAALGQYFLRAGQLDDAIEAFGIGLQGNPDNRYLLPGLFRAHGLAGHADEARGLIQRAEKTFGEDEQIVQTMKRSLAIGDYGVVPLPTGPVQWRSGASPEGLGALALLYRRAATRQAFNQEGFESVLSERAEVLEHVDSEGEVGLAVASELMLGGAVKGNTHRNVRVVPLVQELLRTRGARQQWAGHPYTTELFDELTFDSSRAGVADQRLAPLQELSRLRAASALVDGAELSQHGQSAILALVRLRNATVDVANLRGAPSVGQRRSAWARTILDVLGTSDADEPRWESLVEANALQLTMVEEDVTLGVMT